MSAKVCRRCLVVVEEKDQVAHDLREEHVMQGQVKGSRIGTSKLNEQQVREIKQLLPSRTRSWIADQFGVSTPTIDSIAVGRTWSWLDAENTQAN